MTASSKMFKDLVVQAYSGELKLPAFQRKWKWNRQKVITLYDSLRQRYPIGSLLFLKRGSEFDLAPRAFEGAAPAAERREPELLVLDGQQRLTAGIHLFYGTGPTHYFIDVKKLFDLFKEKYGTRFKDKNNARQFVDNLDVDDTYCIARKASGNAEARLNSNHLLWTRLLTDDADLTAALKAYVRTYPDYEDFIDNILRPHFRLTDTDTVPFTTIEATTSIEAISRIFSTLNTTGQLLTPFELVV